jgi:DNA-binding MarR family transcriptional regulator
MSDDALESARLIDRLERLARSGESALGLNPAQWEALRYLERANRFSRTPAALADYLGSTRGTVSQTLIALENKGFVRREPSERDKRSIDLSLTKRGERTLKDDPLRALARDIGAAGPDISGFIEVLRGTLRKAIARNGSRPFGACYSCTHFRPDARAGSDAPHHCALLDQKLSARDSEQICFEQQPAV